MKKRIEFIDLAKGICISLVVLLHVLGDLSGTIVNIMNLFRMPLYFVLSGLFFKTYDGLYSFFKKKTNKLLVPFLFMYFIVILPSSFLLNIKNGVVISAIDLFYGGHGKLNLGINGTVWFLICLFVLNLLFYIIFLITRRNIICIGILSCICGLIGYGFSYCNLYILLWADSALTAMPFFFVGYVLRCYTKILYGNITRTDLYACGVSFILLLCVFFYDKLNGTGVIVYGSNTFDINILSIYIGGLAGTYCVLMISKYLKYVPILSYIGRYSIVVLLTHLLYLFIIRNILYQLSIPQEDIILNVLVFVVVLMLEIPTIKFCIRYLPYFFAQKDIWR